MNKNWKLTLGIIILLGCNNPKNIDNQIASVAKSASDIKAELEVKKEKMNLVENGKQVPSGQILSKDSLSISIDRFKGKLLIIDFWATWCSPCLTEAPIFNGLGEKYKSGKVEFITISVDDEFWYWKKFLQENDWEGKNYWLGMKEEEPFFSFMYSEMEIDSTKTVLIGLPKYVIIGPSGKILNNCANKPSNPKFEEEVQKLIKEHAT